MNPDWCLLHSPLCSCRIHSPDPSSALSLVAGAQGSLRAWACSTVRLVECPKEEAKVGEKNLWTASVLKGREFQERGDLEIENLEIDFYAIIHTHLHPGMAFVFWKSCKKDDDV